jgi:eukaryotic-like serine/threonine-protein kinase
MNAGQSATTARVCEDDPNLGTRLSAYVLLEQLGSGGTSTVYRASHVDLGIEFAVKVLHHDHARDVLFIERLRREAAVGIRINHPRIVKVLELGMSPRGPFLVMELLRGRTLYEVLKEQGALPPARAARILRQAAEGLAAAHRAGFIHRDLKPGNLMLVPTATGEEVKILDFGIVRLTDETVKPLTRDDLVLGTPSFMAPEQFQSSSVGPAADLYALGVILFQMISGRLPFEGSFREVVAQHMITEPPPAPPSEGLEELASWLLEKNPLSRPPDAERVIEVIDRRFPEIAREAAAIRIVRGTPIAPPPPAMHEPPKPELLPASMQKSGALAIDQRKIFQSAMSSSSPAEAALAYSRESD